MDDHMKDKEKCNVEFMKGRTDGIKYFYLMVKEPYFTMKIMLTYGEKIFQSDKSQSIFIISTTPAQR